MLHTTENAGEDLPLRRFHCNGENRLKPYDEFGSARFGGPEETRTLKKYCISNVNLKTVFILCS